MAFKDDRHQISVYAVSSTIELARVLVAMNATPGRPSTEKIVLAWFTEEDIQSRGMSIYKVNGDTRCCFANSLHHDIKDDRTKIIALIESAMQIKRDAIRFNKKKMRKAPNSAENAGCYATDNPKVQICTCGF